MPLHQKPKEEQRAFPASGFLQSGSWWQSYLYALVLTLGTIILRRWLDMLGDDVVPFALFYPVVLVCTLLWGVGAGIMSLLISAIAVTIFWLDPRGMFGLSKSGLINFLLFAITSAATIYVAWLLRSANSRLRRSEARLAMSQEVGKIGAWEWDLRTGHLWWSPTFYEVVGIDPRTPASVDTFMEHIHPDDREHANEALAGARSGVRRLETEFRFKKDDGAIIWLAGRAELMRDREGYQSRLLGICFDLTPIRQAERERDRANSLLHTFFESLPGAAYVKDTEGRILLGNKGFAAAVGHQPETFLGKTDLEFVADEEQARAMMAHDRSVLEEGVSCSFEEDLLLCDGRMTHWLSVKTPFSDGDGRPLGIVGVSLDITERRKAEERLRFLADEVDHRAKNLLGVVQSIVRLAKIEDVTAFKAAVCGRIQALARAHTLLAASRWQGVDIATLVKQELAPFDLFERRQVDASGPAITLDPNTTQAFAMVVHELAINAAKYGALSVEHGRLEVEWTLEERDGRQILAFVWTESGGPEVVPPAELGFGSTTMRGAIEHQFGGEINLAWKPSGVCCRILLPLKDQTVQQSGSEGFRTSVASSEPAHESEVRLADKRVLIVDDEALIALSLKDAVEELGCMSIGPVGSPGAALDLVKQGAPDLAILDVNLKGESSAPVAKALRALGIPYVYCTGYVEPASQVEAGLQAEMLTKPCDPHDLARALRRAVAESLGGDRTRFTGGS